jgi:2-polyprenyl-3-methyl-5-hydroxy-6-metoxy-1,4-benzoquinol methylase
VKEQGMSLKFENTELAKNAWEEVATLQGWDPSTRVELGAHTAFQYQVDPKHLCFVLSRYKFCSKLLARKRRVLEVGCGDAFGTPIVAQAVSQLVAMDWDARLVEGNAQRLAFVKNCTFKHHDLVTGALPDMFDGIYSVDVLEHIDPAVEDVFMRNSCAMLEPQGMLIVGTPNQKAEAYASASSKRGHINLKDAPNLERLLATYFQTVLLFSMNDEVIHTGFYPMAHYLFGIGVGLKTPIAR